MMRAGDEPLAVYRDRIAGGIFDFDILRLIGRLLRRDRQPEHVVVRLAPRILEDAALVADVHQIAVHRVGFLGGHRHRNLLLAA